MQSKVDYIRGTASFVLPAAISVQVDKGSESTVEAKNFITATRSEVTLSPVVLSKQEEQTVSSTDALLLRNERVESFGL